MHFSPSASNLYNLRESPIFNINKRKDFVSPKEFFQDYINYYKKNPIVDIDGFSGINKKLFVERYTNDLVTEKKYLDIKKFDKIKKRQESTRLIKEKLEEKELNNFIKLKKNKKIIQKINKKVKRSEGEDEEEEKRKYEKKRLLLKQKLEESKKPKIFKMKLLNPETDRIINRYEDIRMLEYNYIKNYSDYSIDPNIFNEYFYNVKKKFNQIIQKGNKSSDSGNSSGRNNNKTKGLLKNYSVILPKIEKKERKFLNNFSIDSPGNSINIKRINPFSP